MIGQQVIVDCLERCADLRRNASVGINGIALRGNLEADHAFGDDGFLTYLETGDVAQRAVGLRYADAVADDGIDLAGDFILAWDEALPEFGIAIFAFAEDCFHADDGEGWALDEGGLHSSH